MMKITVDKVDSEVAGKAVRLKSNLIGVAVCIITYKYTDTVSNYSYLTDWLVVDWNNSLRRVLFNSSDWEPAK